MERYLCIHGHFYQPPRENPWLEAVELQDSAHPYHDWNARITAECYAANAASRIMDEHGRIERIANNYSRISFNFGPTLLAWMESNDPDTYRAILEADRESRERFSGHGSALAQAYNHIILPLANRRDKRTQVLWGIRDFEHRFGRSPEGLWLPETAVDLETLDLLAEAGIRFTILAPHQAGRVRRMGVGDWHDVTGAKIEPRRAYLQRLPSGRSITIFFYDGPASQGVAFEGLLTDGEQLAQRLVGLFSDYRSWAELVHIATDGETYGHHHRHGDMALAYALHIIESEGLARLTNYGEYLERHPPTHEVEIIENTSWSCAHGIDRWRSNCGCRTGGEPGWNQAWRKPLRDALDWLRDSLAPAYEERARALLRDPWAARDDYSRVILGRSPELLERFLARHATRSLAENEKVTAVKLLELQRHAMLMYTSCGWFFNELSGIETVQVIQYAGRALQLAQQLFGGGLEKRFLAMLEQAKCNVAEHGDGRKIFEKFVKPAMVDLLKVGAHYAASSLFEEYANRARIFCYTVNLRERQALEAGAARLAVGRARITSEVTRESALVSYAVLHLGDHNLNGGIREFPGERAHRMLARELASAFSKGDMPATIRLLDRHFRGSTFSLHSLFRDQQRRVVDRILESTLAEAEGVYHGLYEHHASLMRFVSDLGIPLPKAFQVAAEFVVNTSLARIFSNDELDLERAQVLLDEARRDHIALDAERLGFALEQTLDRLAGRVRECPARPAPLEKLVQATALAAALPFEVDLWNVQNIYYDMLQTVFRELRSRADAGDESARRWVDRFTALGENLSVAIA